MADEEEKSRSGVEQIQPAATEDQETEHPKEHVSAPTEEQPTVTEEQQPTDAPVIEGEVKEAGEEITPDDTPEKKAEEADAATSEGAPQEEKQEVEANAPDTSNADAPTRAPDQEAGGDAGQEQKAETEEKPEEMEAPPQELQKSEEEQPKTEEVAVTEEPALPQNEDFATGEEPEAPINVSADVLSREGTPTVPPEGGLEEGDMVRPSTPEKDGEEKEVVYEEEEEEDIPKLSREELVEKYNAALQEREVLNQKNHALQHKLAEYFRRKKTEDSRQEVDRNVTDQEQRYMKYMSNLEELRQQESGERESYNEQIEEMKERRAAKQGLVEEEWGQYCDFKRSVALASVNSRSGRPLTLKEFEVYEINEVKKEAEVSQVRLENIKLKNRLRKRELQLKQKEELAEGLHLIDFEQLKIENQTYNEKIEERNEELMKLRKKITSTVQVLTHLKEKLQFVQGENQVAKQELSHIEAEVAGKRDILSRTKQARDALRHDNSKLQQKCGLLGNRLLLRDYEEGVDEIGDLSHRLDQLKRTHAELTLSISGVKKKIEQARVQAQS